MRPDRKAKFYAQTLLLVAKQTDSVQVVNDSLEMLAKLVKKDSAFRAFFNTQRITPDKKVELLNSVLKSANVSCNTIVLELFGIISEKKEYRFFPRIVKFYSELMFRELNLVKVTTFSADELTSDEYEAIHVRLEKVTRKKAQMEKIIDPLLLGGIKLRIGNIFLDGSILNRLEKMKFELIKS